MIFPMLPVWEGEDHELLLSRVVVDDQDCGDQLLIDHGRCFEVD